MMSTGVYAGLVRRPEIPHVGGGARHAWGNAAWSGPTDGWGPDPYKTHVGQVPAPPPAPVPHKCTARSAAAIAAQIDPAWKYVSSLPPGYGYRCVSTTREYDVVTAQGPKRIPATFCADMLLLKCPYTHETFVFKGGPRPYIERPLPISSHVGQAPPAPQPPAPTCPAGQAPIWNVPPFAPAPGAWICTQSTTESWGTMTFAQKFESVAFLVAFGLIFITLAFGAAIFGSPV